MSPVICLDLSRTVGAPRLCSSSLHLLKKIDVSKHQPFCHTSCRPSLVIRAVAVSEAGKRETKMDGFASRFSLMLAAYGTPLRAPFAVA